MALFNTILTILLDNSLYFAIISLDKIKNRMERNTQKEKLRKVHGVLIDSFLEYQSLKYYLTDIEPLSKEYYPIVFKKDSCFIGETEIEQHLMYLCDAELPNREVKNILLCAKKEGEELVVTIYINFLGYRWSLNYTKEENFHRLDDNVSSFPNFKLICTEDQLDGQRRNNNMP